MYHYNVLTMNPDPEAAQQRLQQTLLAADVEHHRMLIEQPLDRILWEFLRYRQDKAY